MEAWLCIILPATGLVGLIVGKGQLERKPSFLSVCLSNPLSTSFFFFKDKLACVSKRLRILTTAHCLGTVITILNKIQPVLPKCEVYVGNSGLRLVFQMECYTAMCLCCLFHEGKL